MAKIHKEIRKLLYNARPYESAVEIGKHFHRNRQFVERMCRGERGFNCNDEFCEGLAYYGYELRLVKIDEQKGE